MSRDASLTFDWADGVYTFRLGWAELEKLQEACDAGPFVILGRLDDATCKVQDISNTIKYGLIGGGMAPAEATKKVREWVEGRVPAENILVARVILQAACVGAPEEQIEKKSEAPDQNGSTISQTERSGSEPSTDLERASA